jgi:outer membrane protein TolC
MKPFLLFAIFFLYAGLVSGQIRFSSLDEMIQYADKNSLVTQQAQLQITISKKQTAINQSALLPKLNVFGTADYYPIITSQVIPESIFGGPAGKFTKVQFGLPLSFSSGVELTLPVINFEKWEQLKRYRLQELQTKFKGDADIENLHIQITQWYYQALLARELVLLNQSDLLVTDELMRILTERRANGILNPADYNRSKNLQLDMQAAAIQYDKNYQEALIVLQQLLNLPAKTNLLLSDSIAGKNWQMVPDTISINKRPSWLAASAGTSIAAQQLRETEKGALPKIAFTGKYTYQWQMKPSADQHVNFDFSSIGIRLDFPLFQGFYYRETKQMNKMQLLLGQSLQTQTANDLNRQQAEWWNSYKSALKRQDMYTQKLSVAKENLHIAQLNMKEGVMEFDEFNNIFQEYNKARIDFLQNYTDGIVYQLLLNIK